MILKGDKIRNAWEDVREVFERKNQNDVFYCYDYLSLYSGSNTTIEAFIYNNNSNILFFPYLKRSIGNGNEEYYDFETAYGYGGALSTTTCTKFLKEAWEEFYVYALDQNIIAGFIRFHPIFNNEDYVRAKYIEIEYMRPTVYINLNDRIENIWKKYKPDVRNKVNKAIRNGVEIYASNDFNALEQFFILYQNLIMEKEADYIYSFGENYFYEIGKKLNNCSMVYLAKQSGKIIGGALILFSKKIAHYHLSAVDSKAKTTGTASLLRHYVINDLIDKKEILHFGGGKTNHPSDSLLRFKMRFSNELGAYHIGKVMINQQLYQEICACWSEKYPEKTKIYKDFFLKYRF